MAMEGQYMEANDIDSEINKQNENKQLNKMQMKLQDIWKKNKEIK